jgi:hypothetical protein
MTNKDTDGDGWKDNIDPAPNNPLVPQRADTAGITGAGAQSGITITGAGDGGVTYIDTTNMDPETAREARNAYRGNPNYTTDPTKAPLTPDVPLGGGGGTYNGPTTTKQKEVTTYTLQQVKGLANQAFQAAIGREATKTELSKFLEHLNTAEKKSPDVTISRTKPSGHNATVSRSTSGGVDEQQFAADQARLNPEYAGYQQATTYFDAMLNTLGGTAGRGV